MRNLMKIAQPGSARIREQIAGLRQKRETLLQRIESNSQIRTSTAFEAHAGGNRDAQEAMQRAAARDFELQQELRGVESAISDGERRLQEAEAAEAAREHADCMAALKKLTDRRTAQAAAVDKALAALAREVEAMDGLDREMRQQRRLLRGLRSGALDDPLLPEAARDRFAAAVKSAGNRLRQLVGIELGPLEDPRAGPHGKPLATSTRAVDDALLARAAALAPARDEDRAA